MDSPLGIVFQVAHMNFSLRGDESDGDQALVERFCSENGIVCHTRKVDTASYAVSKGISIEMAARELRYEWFNTLLEELHLDRIAVAHNLNDSVETLYLNLLRGTGIKGLSGINAVSGRVFRPMLGFTRAEIEKFAAASEVPFRVDSTNLESEYARNRIRNEVFPHFAAINPSFLATARSNMKHFSQGWEIIAEDMQRFSERACHSAGGVLTIDIPQLEDAGHVSFRLHLLLEKYGFNPSQAEAAASSLEGRSGGVFTSATHTLVRDRGKLKVYPSSGVSTPEGCRVRVFSRTEGFDPHNAPEGILYADADLLRLPLSCRRWKAADRFRPLGMKNFRKVSDFFKDIKLDVEQKKRATIVTMPADDGTEQIVCILGIRLDDRWRISEKTASIAEISAQ